MHPLLRRFHLGLPSLPVRRACWRAEGLGTLPKGFGTAQIVIARSRCCFGRFDLSPVPPGKRAQALSLQVAAWSPFTTSDAAVAWQPGGRANVWCWSADELDAAWRAGAGADRLPRPVPESELYPAPASDGLRMLKTLDGVEAQLWQDRSLVASRWWPQTPDDRELLSFQQDASRAPDQIEPMPALTEFALGRHPVQALAAFRGSAGTVAGAESMVYGVLVLALGIPALALAVQEWRLLQARQQTEATLQREGSRAKAVLDAQISATKTADQVRALSALQVYPAPLVHMLAIARALPSGAEINVREWEMNDGKLRLLLASSGSEIQGAANMQAFEQVGLFTDTKILNQADPRLMAFTMRMKPQAALALDVQSAGSEKAAPKP